MARPRKERILERMRRVRAELLETLKEVKAEEFDWKPRPDMKSVKDMLKECGAVEAVIVSLVRDGKAPDFEGAVAWSGEDLEAILSDLQRIREETERFLETCPEEKLDATFEAGGRKLEGEEFLRFIPMHEYYHLGQIIYNRWMLGYNPYAQGKTDG